MTETAITIVGTALDKTAETRAASLAKETGVESLRIEILKQNYAIDILVSGDKPAFIAALRQKFQLFGKFDIFVQPNDTFRKKKLLIADMDATMIEQETLDELAIRLNLQDKIIPITEKAMRGEIDFVEALNMRVGLLKGMPAAALYETLKEVRYSKGADELVKTMRRHGAKCVLISGGFDMFTSHVASTLGFHQNFGNQLEINNHHLTGKVIPPIVDKFTKEKQVVEQVKMIGCDLKHALAVGDGANDIPMLKKSGVGVGYFGKPAVVEATPHQIRHTDLMSILYMQGYRAEEIYK